MIALAALAASKSPAAGSIMPGVLGFLVVAGMGLLLFFLLRSMNKQLRRVSGGARWQRKPGEGGESAASGSAAKPKSGPAKAQGGSA